MTDLKPCPFCGSEAVMMSNVRWLRPRYYRRKARGVCWFIGCTDPECILYLDKKTKNARLIFQSRNSDLMIRRWNRRIEDEGAD